MTDLEKLAVNAIRVLAMDGVEKAKSGHPGLPMGCADIAYVLYTKILTFNPKNPTWPDRDRFVLSAVHPAGGTPRCHPRQRRRHR